MVDVVTGGAAGLANTSRVLVGAPGQFGAPQFGRAGEQVTVNAATGNLVVQNRDELLFGAGPDVELLRTYNSQGAWDGDNGDNWRIGYYRRVTGLTGTVNTAGSTIRRLEADGFESTYSYNGSIYVSTDGAGAYDTLGFNAATGVWTWTDGDTGVNETYTESTAGSGDFQLTRVTDTEGHSVRIAYGAGGLISTLSTWKAGAATADETLALSYDNTNSRRLTQITSTVVGTSGSPVTRTRVRYEYNNFGQLAAVRTDLSPEDGSVADGRAYSVEYGYNINGRLSSITQTDGTSLGIEYDQFGRVARLTDALSRVTTVDYDAANCRTTITDPLNQATVLTYDTRGRLVQASGAAMGGGAFSQSYTYTPNSDVATVRDGLGRETVFAYNANGDLVRRTDAAGNVLERSFDSANRLVSETLYTVPDPDGAAGAGLPGGAQRTLYVYDTTAGRRRLAYSRSPEGRITQYGYNALGQRSTSTVYVNNLYTATTTPTLAELDAWSAGLSAADRALAQRSDFGYDLRGQLSSVRQYAGATVSGSTVTYANASEQRSVYDAFGRLLQSIDGNGNTSVFAYDGLDRVASRQDAGGAVTVYTYDDAGRRTSVQLANGLTTLQTFDTAGNLVSSAQSQGGPTLSETRYFYDANDRLRMTQDPTGLRSWIYYDAAGRKVADVDATGRYVEYAYDAAGRLVQSVQFATLLSAATLATLVDADGRPVERSLAQLRPAASAAADRVTTRYVDAAGRLVGMQDADGYLSETQYDGAGRAVTTIAYAAAGSIVRVDTSAGSTTATPPAMVRPAADAANDRRARNLYDNDALLRGTLDAEGYLVELRYDAAGRLVERIAYANATDPAQRSAGTLAQLLPAANNAADRRSVNLYDGKGQLVGEVDAEGYLTEHVYDTAGNRTQTLRYARSVTGAVSTTSSLASLRPASSNADVTARWDYDALNRVRLQTASDGTVTQTVYDNVGNRISTIQAVGQPEVRTLSARYDAQGRLTAELSAEGAALLTGSQTQAQIDAIWQDWGSSYGYDAAGRRISARDARGNVTVYYYDAAGRRVYSILKTPLGGEVQQASYNSFGELEGSVTYAARLSAADTAALTGGLVDATLASRVAALADTAHDLRNTTVYGRRSQVQQAIDALGNRSDYGYNAFGQVVTSQVDQGDGRRQRTDFGFDRRGLLLSTTLDGSALNLRSSSEYDAFGRVTASVDARGRRTTYAYIKNDGTPDGGRQVVVTDPANVAHGTVYDAFDRVLRQTDAFGNSVRYTYDGVARRMTVVTAEGIQTVTETSRHGQVVRVTDGTGAVTSYAYDRNGKLLTTTDAAGNVTQNSYDAVGNLTATTVGLRSNGSAAPSNDGSATTTSFSYDAANRLLLKTVDPGGLALQTSYAYDGRGRAVRVTDAAGVVTSYAFDAKGQLTDAIVDDVTGGLRLRTTYTYDGEGRTRTVTEGVGTAAAKTTEYRYDVLGRRTQEIVDPAGLALTSTYEYDAIGNVVLKRDPLGNGTRYVYDAVGRLKYTIDALGSVVQRLYDAEGRLTGSKAYVQRLAGSPPNLNIAALTDAQIETAVAGFSNAADQLTQWAYDRDGRQVYAIDAEGGVTQSRYDAAGRVIETIRYATRRPGVWAAGATPTVDATRDQSTLTVYDAIGRPRYSVDALNFVTELTYDRVGRVVASKRYARNITRPATATESNVGAAIAGRLDAANDRTDYSVYDNAGRLRFSVDAEGYATERSYDALGRVTSTFRHEAKLGYATPPTLAQVAAATQFVYRFDSGLDGFISNGGGIWEAGALKMISQPVADSSWGSAYSPRAVAPGATVKFDLTPNSIQDDLHAGVESAAGNPSRLMALLRADGHVWVQTYDPQGSPRTIDLGAYTAGTTYTVEVTTNARGGTLYFYVKGSNRDAGYVYRSPSDFGWTTLMTRFYAKRTSTLTTQTTAVIDNIEERSGTLTTNRYDAAGRLTHSVDAEGIVTRYAYDASGRLTDTTEAFGRPEATTTHRVYDQAGRLIEETAGYGSSTASVTRYRYDANGRLTAKVDPRAVALAEGSDTWSTSERPVLGYPASAASLTAAQRQALLDRYTTSYTYDSLGQRTGVTDALGRTTTTAYDAFGCAAQLTDARGYVSYAYYDKLNRKVQEVDAERYLTVTTYDAFGNATDSVRYDAKVAGSLVVSSSVVVGAADPGNGRAYVIVSAAGDAADHSEFDRNNRLLWQRDAEGYVEGSLVALDAFGQRVSVTNKRGAVATYTYDRAGRVIIETLPVTAANASGVQVAVVNRSQYDSRGNRVQLIEAEGLPEQRITRFTFDSADRLVRTLKPAYQAVDAAGATSTVNPVDELRYDAFGNVVEQIVSGNLVNGRVTGGKRSLAYYDTLQRRTTEVSADAVLARYTHDPAGNVVMHTIFATRLASLPATAGGAAPTVTPTADDRTLSYVYDALGRKTETRLDGVWSWEQGEPLNVTTAQRITIERLDYDAMGNVTQRTDARGNATYQYFDGVGRKVLVVDPMGYGTALWYARAFSAVTSETRYAGQLANAVARQAEIGATDTQVAELRLALTNASSSMPATQAEANRSTNFTLDRLGRVTQRQLLGVQFEHVQADGTLVRGTADAITRYVYDGLGHVTQTSERTAELAGGVSVWEVTDAGYDGLGRETLRLAPGFADQNGSTVRPRTEQVYDGLGNVVRRTQRGNDGSTEADDRIFLFSYSGDRLVQETDAEGAVTRYDHDAIGEVSRRTVVGVRRSDGSTRDLVTTYQVDAAGRIIVETDVDTGLVKKTRYNAFGEVSAKGTGDGWQEFAEYTTLGKVWRTNSGDGAVKIYLQDKTGNTTREIRAGGTTDLRNTTLAAASADATLFHTVSVYDKRGQLERTIEPRMELQTSGVALSQLFTEQWVPEYGDLNVVNSNGGSSYQSASIGQGQAYTTVSTSAGTGTALAGGAPGVAAAGVVLGAQPTPNQLNAWSVLNWRTFSYSLDPSPISTTSLSSVSRSFTIPSDWAAGNYRVTDTIGSYTAVRTSTAQRGSSVAIGSGAAGGTGRIVIEYQRTATSGWATIATANYEKDAGDPSETLPRRWAVRFYGLSVTAQSDRLLAFDSAEWAGATDFLVTFDPDGSSPQAQHVYATTGGFPYFQVSVPTLSADTHTVRVQARLNGVLVGGRNYTMTGSNVATLADAGAVSRGANGNFWADYSSGTFTAEGISAANAVIRYRPVVADGRGAWVTRSFALGSTTISSMGLLAGTTYEFVTESAGSYRYGQFTVSGTSIIPANSGMLRVLSRADESIQIAGPAGGSVTLTVGAYTRTVDVSGGFATFNLKTARTALGLDDWTPSNLTYAYKVFSSTQGDGRVTNSDRGTVSFGTLINAANGSANNVALTSDGVDEYAGEGVINDLAGASGTMTLTVNGASVTLPVNGSNWRVQQVGSSLVLNLRQWAPAWGAPAQLVNFTYSGNDGYILDGSFSITYAGVVTAGSLTPRTINRPILPITITGAAAMTVFRVGPTSDSLADALGEISGTGPTFSWNATSRLGQDLRYEYEARDAGGVLIGKGSGRVIIDSNGSITQSEIVTERQPALVRFIPPAATASFQLQMRTLGSSSAYTQYGDESFTLDGATRIFRLDQFHLVPEPPTATFADYEYLFIARDANGAILTRGGGNLHVDSNGATSGSKFKEDRPTPVQFKIARANALRASLRIRPLGGSDLPAIDLIGVWVPPVINADGSPGQLGYMRFTWDAAAFGNVNTATTYDYVLTAQDGNGAALYDEIGRAVTQSGRVVLDPAGSQPVQLQQLVSALTLDSNILVTRHQLHNAFGEVIEERDDRVADRMKAMLGVTTLTTAQADAARTALRYNTLGQLISKSDPETYITLANGYRYRDRPVTQYGYDLVGRTTTTTDANGNLTKQSLLAGTRGDQALAQAEFFADTGVRRTSYDAFGDARRIVDQENNTDLRYYDKMSRLVQVDHLGIQRVDSNGVRGGAQTLTERYTYDQLGQRLSQTNAAGFTSRQDYDGQGRVTRTVSAEGFQTSYQYEFRAGGAASDGVTGLGTDNIGGTRRTTFQADGRTLIDKIDYFGHATWHQDLSGAQFTYVYDRGAHLVSQTGTVHAGQTLGQNIAYTYYANGYIKSMTDNTVGTLSEYAYDNAGNRVYEAYFGLTNGTKNGSYQAATITYDELNRIARIQDTSYFDINYEYDANSNRRMVDSVYWDGVGGLRDHRQTYWYAYDSLNRFTITMGELSGARATSRTDTSVTVRAGTEGTTLGYDKLSRRISATYTYNGSQILESYGYSQDGFLETTSQGGVLKTVRVLDSLGRTTSYHVKNSANVNNNYEDSSSHTTYDRDNRILRTEYWDIDGTKNHAVDYYYFNDATDNQSNVSAGGAGALARTVLTPDVSAGPSPTVITTTYTYSYWDDAKQTSVVKSAVNPNAPNWRPGSTTITYNANGHLKTNRDNVASITTTYFNNAQGLVLRRERQQGNSRVGSHYYYYADGKRIGDVSDDPSDNPRVSYAEALASKNATPVDRRQLYRNFRPVTSADFDQNFEPINESYPGPVPGSYTVREGDNLQLIAQNLWGDRSLWFLIADANGLSGTETLQAGRVLTIPNQVTNIHNNASTFRPYDAGEAMGSIDPTLPPAPPPPQRDKGCGTFLMIVIAVVVACVVGPEAVSFFQGLGGAAAGAGAGAGTAAAGASAAAAGAGTFATAAGFAVGAAAGSIASQAFGLATGTIDSFSWKAVGQAALGGAIGGAVSTLNIPGLAGSYAAAAKAAIGTGIAQALHGDWNWTAVLASALGAGVGTQVGQWAGRTDWGNALNGLGKNIVAGLAGGAAAVAVTGGRARYDSVFVSTLSAAIGNALGDRLASDDAQQNHDALTRAAYDQLVGEFSRQQEPYDPTGGVQVAGPYTGPTNHILPDMVIRGSRADLDEESSSRSFGRLPRLEQLATEIAYREPIATNAGPTIEPLSVPIERSPLSLETQLEIERVSRMPQHYATPVDVEAEAHAEAQRVRTANNIAMFQRGPFVGMPMAAARYFGVSEAGVAQTGIQASAFLDLYAPRGPSGVATLASRRRGLVVGDANRAYLDGKFGRTGDLNFDINARGARDIQHEVDRLAREGHAPARHGPRVTEGALDNRVLFKFDPITGTTTDYYTRESHNVGRNATKMLNNPAMVRAEAYVRGTSEFAAARAEAELFGRDRFPVKGLSLEQALGQGYLSDVFGKARVGSVNNPMGTVPIDFTDGTLTSVFMKGSGGYWNLHTMYPEPKP